MTTDIKVVSMAKPAKPYLERLLEELAAEYSVADSIRADAVAKMAKITRRCELIEKYSGDHDVIELLEAGYPVHPDGFEQSITDDDVPF